MGMNSLGRAHRVDLIVEMLDWLEEHPAAIASNATLSELRQMPGLSPAVADFAIRVHPGPEDDRDEPVLATAQLLRTASRFLGGHVEHNRNLHSDGRLAVSRMIGGDENSHEAHLALFELAASHCGPGSPECGPCPLVDRCAYATETGFQPTLPVTSPVAEPVPDR